MSSDQSDRDADGGRDAPEILPADDMREDEAAVELLRDAVEVARFEESDLAFQGKYGDGEED